MTTGYDHVVLVSLDTLRSDAISANPCKLFPAKYGIADAPPTPSLDWLAARGAFFPNCISSAPYTSASHASFFTGRWPLRHGVYEFFNRRLTSRTLFTHARRLGYRTRFKTDFPLILGRFLGFDRDVDEYLIEDDEAFLAGMERGRPSFSFVHFGGLHMPYGFHNLRFGGQAYIDKVRALESGVPVQAGDPADSLVETYRDPEDLDLLLRYKRIVQYHYSRGDYRFLFSLYLEGLTFFLENRFTPFLERLLARLSGTRFLLVLFGDHGEEYDETSYGHHNTLNEGVIRVPVIFWGTDVRPGMYAERIRSVDIAPTVLDLLGVSLPRLRLDGESLVDTVRAAERYPRRTAFAQAYTSDTREFVRYQERLLRAGRKLGSLRHVLYKEAVYDGPLKLTRQYYRYAEHGGISALRPCAPVTTLDDCDHPTLRPVHDPEAQRRLISLADGYRSLRRRRSAPPVRAADEIREQLRNMGYRV